jgi:hypothetical protein
MNIEDFKIKTYGVTELALLYSPECIPSTALARLRRWIAKNENLRTELIKLGWQPGNRMYTPRQVGCIVDFIGEP